MSKIIKKYYLTIYTLAVLFLVAIVCAGMGAGAAFKGKHNPEWHDIDPKAKPLHDEYIDLAKQNHLTFKHTVNIGFKHINEGNAIGVCYYFKNREIDIDIDYWNHNSDTQRKILLFHELTHCYCERGHDWAKDKNYPETYIDKKIQFLRTVFFGTRKAGYFEDDCPMSLMSPTIVSDFCYYEHGDRYLQELFERCNEY